MYCQNCGRELEPDAGFCPNCGMRINNIGYGTSYGSDPNFAPKSAVYLRDSKNEVLAALLSAVIPGVGHIYVSNNAKGVKILTLSIGLAMMWGLLLASDMPYYNSVFGMFATVMPMALFVLWIYGIVDSAKEAHNYNRDLADNGKFR